MEVALPHNPHRNWPFLNCVRHHKGIFFLSQATHADGITIRQSCLTQDTGLESNMTFPKQQPTAANFEVWCRTLYTISSLALRAVVACDNMGVVIHGNDCHHSLCGAQSQHSPPQT
jgi:hypothetical protein